MPSALKFLRAPLLWGLISLVAATFSAHADTSQLDESIAFDIPAQRLENALFDLAKQSEFQILFSSGSLPDHSVAAVSGKMQVKQALSLLLVGTELGYKLIGERTITVGPGKVSAGDLQTAVRVAQSDSTATPNLQASNENPEDQKSNEAKPESLQEILVTAQKREERLKDVPISIAVLGGADLDKSKDPDAFAAMQRVPGVVAEHFDGFGIGGVGSNLAIRGIAGGGFNSSANSVGYYLDGVPFGGARNAMSPDASAYDLERIEILRGPQGTLYGVTALVGVVRILTKPADLDNLELKTRSQVSQTDHGGFDYRADAALNIPLVADKLAVRAVGGYRKLSGFIDVPLNDDYNGQTVGSFRLKMAAKPSGLWSFNVTAWAQNNDQDGGGQSLQDPVSHEIEFLHPEIETREPNYGKLRVLSMENALDMAGTTLTSNTGLITYKGFSQINFGVYPSVDRADYTNGRDARTFSQELYLNSASAGAWRWSLGAMYNDARSVQILRLFDVASSSDVFNVNMKDSSKSYAFFGQVTRLFLDERLELTAGLRNFHDDYRYFANLRSLSATPLVNREGTASATTPRMALTWHQSKDITFYASYSEGFRSGQTQEGFILLPEFGDPNLKPVDPDKLISYEMGSEGTLLNGKLTFESALYYQVWQDRQASRFVHLDRQSSDPSVGVSVLLNAEDANGLGFEGALTAHPTSGLELGINFGWTGLENTKDIFLPNGNIAIEKGSALPGVPVYTAGTFANYRFSLSGEIESLLSLSYHWEQARIHGQIAAPVSLLTIQRDEVRDLRASFSILTPRNLQLSLFATNILNDQAPLRALYPTTDPLEEPSVIRPRMIGIQLEYGFGPR